MQPSLRPMQGRAARPARAFAGRSGSAMIARVIATRSTPLATHASAIAGSTLRPATMTGTPTASRKRRARSLKTPSGQLVAGHEVRGRQPRRARAAAHAEQVDRAGRREAARHLDQLVGAEPAGQALIDRHPEADDEVVGDRGAHGFQHLAAEAGAVLEAAAVLVRARVDAGVEELLDQVPAERRHLAAVPAAALQARRRVREPLHDRRDLRDGQRHGHLEVDALRKVGRRAQRNARQRRRAAPPHVRHLRHAAAHRGRGRRRPARAAPARCARPRARSSRTTPPSSGRPRPSRTS